MFDGFSSLLKPENTSEFSPRFSVSFSRGRRNEFSLSSLQVASGENFWGFCEAIEKSRGNRKKLVIAMLWGDGGLRSAAVEIRGPSTQNPLVATPCGFESHHRHHPPKRLIPQHLRHQAFLLFSHEKHPFRSVFSQFSPQFSPQSSFKRLC